MIPENEQEVLYIDFFSPFLSQVTDYRQLEFLPLVSLYQMKYKTQIATG